jgi:anti-anti-sigma factor
VSTLPTGDTTGGVDGGGTAGETVEVVLHGELDLAAYEHAERRVEQAERGSPELLVIDLSRLTFMDSSGVRLVLLAHDRARAAGRRLAVRLGVSPAQRVFDSLGLIDKLDVLPVTDAPTEQPPEAVDGPSGTPT